MCHCVCVCMCVCVYVCVSEISNPEKKSMFSSHFNYSILWVCWRVFEKKNLAQDYPDYQYALNATLTYDHGKTHTHTRSPHVHVTHNLYFQSKSRMVCK